LVRLRESFNKSALARRDAARTLLNFVTEQKSLHGIVALLAPVDVRRMMMVNQFQFQLAGARYSAVGRRNSSFITFQPD
jgi:hypothetical protein